MISRIPLMKHEELSPDGRAIYQSILNTRGNLDGPFLAWLHSPGLAAPAEKLGAFCRYGTSLAEIESELLILLVAAHFHCAGEWQIHAPIACKAGLDVASIDAIKAGMPPVPASARLSVLHGFADDLLRHNRVSEISFNRAREMFGDRGCVEIAGVIGYYSFVAMTLNAFEIRFADGGDPLADAANILRDVR
jgi:4-carboxymuconolactone decarboxylase